MGLGGLAFDILPLDEIFQETKIHADKLNIEEKLSCNLLFSLIAKCNEFQTFDSINQAGETSDHSLDDDGEARGKNRPTFAEKAGQPESKNIKKKIAIL
mmetsp:Transcript_35681/g.54601  ORF Transcript_35681/g.54601 Transcript_35681/m.54601 type:complete len:99 (-) Transcript_35681:994-1290(-)